ncbi:MAG: primosomal protein [Paenibacillaceae bacterium]|nr:primosomal protein [Paenibacillaceae bacterium]
MYAKVIVDVPAKQTDRAFDYAVPRHMIGIVEVGSRVGVPFGNRPLHGFVMELCEQTDLDPAKLKYITEVLDAAPPLTGELVELARWLSRRYLCRAITALQVMIPRALKAKYERRIRLAEQADVPAGVILLDEEREIVDYLGKKQEVSFDELLQTFGQHGAAINRLLKLGLIEERQTAKDRMGAKTALVVNPPADAESLRTIGDGLPAQASRQKQLLHYLADHPAPIKLQELAQTLKVSTSSIKALADKGWIELKQEEQSRDPYAGREFEKSEPLPLTEEQDQVYRQIRASLDSREHAAFLLHGVTGSGKTEVYLQSIERCLAQGREAIVLVPEISLTPQMVDRFKGRFGSRVAVLHSRLSDGERYDEWRKIMRRQVSVVIGARSAVFAPFTQLGLIIMDEEHETSYKQEDNPRYHAKEVAIRRGMVNGAVVVLGSATPSLESYWEAQPLRDLHADEGSLAPLAILEMPSRVHGRPLPGVKVVDMRQELREGNKSMFSRALREALEERLLRREQTVLLLNRRGYATFVMCRTCGTVTQCPHCDISLTYHQSTNMLKCHYCGYSEREKKTCAKCGSSHIRHFGTGTQRVEEELHRLFKGIRVIRMDVDTTTEKGSHEKWLTQFRNREADVLLGTQMVAKGLDFPMVTLVGVIAADTVLNLPDFRAAEKTFQLLTQVAGRAGRHELAGEVVVQTYAPEHYSIVNASKHNYREFADLELATRRLRNYPPFHRLILITLSNDQLPALVHGAEALAALLKERIGQTPGNAELYGPVASPIPRIKDRYRFQCMVKYQGNYPATELVRQALQQFDEKYGAEKLQVGVDVDPQMLL